MPDFPFHTQDEFLYCGVACAQMLLHWHAWNLQDLSIFKSDQAAIRAELELELNAPRLGDTRSDDGEVGPYLLVHWLNRNWKTSTASGTGRPGVFTRFGKLLSPPWEVIEADVDVPAKLAGLYEAVDAVVEDGEPGVVLVFEREHWVILLGKQEGSETLEYLDPWLQRYPGGQAPHPGFAHKSVPACGCGTSPTIVILRRAAFGRFAVKVVQRGIPLGRAGISEENLEAEMEKARSFIFEEDDRHEEAAYAVLPNRNALGNWSRRPRRKLAPPLPGAAAPGDLISQLNAAKLTGPDAAEPWSSAGKATDPVESRKVVCAGNASLSYHLHFRQSAGDWLAAVTDHAGQLVDAAVLRGSRPSLANAEADAEKAVRDAKRIRLADGKQVQAVNCTIKAEPGLVWIPCVQSPVPYLPMVQVALSDPATGKKHGSVYVDIFGHIHAKLTRCGKLKKKP